MKNSKIKFSNKINRYIESNKLHADKLFSIAESHKLTYMALNERAINLYRPILKWFEDRKQYDECLEYVNKNIPDCLERNMYISYIHKLKLIRK